LRARIPPRPTHRGRRIQRGPPQHLTVGDHVNVSIVVEADRGTAVRTRAGGIPEDLALAESARFITADKGNGRVEIRIDLVVAPFALGDYPMPIKLRWRTVPATAAS
jgi:hypothetical protein